MFSNKRKTIGVFLFRPDQEYQNILCQGITERAVELGYNVAFFTAFGDYAHNKRFIEGEREMLYLPHYEQLDGVILAIDTFDVPYFEAILLEQLKTRCQCPVVSVRRKIKGFHNVVLDESVAMESVVRHFVEDHGFRDICFMSGPEHKADADLRLQSFLRVMEEHDLPVGEHQIYYGDYWYYAAKDAYPWFFADGRKPEAIICANDYMAVTLCSELIQRGYEVPKDICISGYDGLQEACTFYPSITTVKIPTYEMGVEAMNVIERQQGHGNEDLETIVMDTELQLNESCGCCTTTTQNFAKMRCEFYEASRNDHDTNLKNTFMSVDMEEVNNYQALGEAIEKAMSNVDGYESYYMCLRDGLEIKKGNLCYRDNDLMRLTFGIKERKTLERSNIRFEQSLVLPAEATGESPQIFYISPLHYQDHCFGYQAVSFLETSNSGNIDLPWVVNIENAIEDLLIQQEMERLIGELEYLYVRDSLTGLFNRRGFEKFASAHCSRAIALEKPLFVMGIDLDGMKIINDGYGHMEGDNALRIISEALRAACADNEVCARMGGDEYSVAYCGKTKEEVLEFERRFCQYIDRYNQTSGKPYEVHASYGVYYEVPKSGTTIEEYMNMSDKKMYRNKLKNKKARGEI